MPSPAKPSEPSKRNADVPAPLKTFTIYARADEAFKSQLLRHLRLLRSIAVWHDGNILPGEEWDAAIKRELRASELVLFLVSADSLNSEYIQAKELQTALELLREGQVRLVPIVVAPCPWKFDPILSGLQTLPLYRAEGVKPVRSWPDPDQAWASVVEHLGELVEEIGKQREALEQARLAEKARIEQEGREAEARAERETAKTAREAAQRREREAAEVRAALAARELEERRQREETERRREAEQQRQRAEEQTRREKAAFVAATQANTVEAWDEYLRNFPGGTYESQARQRRKEALRQAKAAVTSNYFSLKNIAIAVVLLVLSGVSVNYLMQQNTPKQSENDIQTPPKSTSPMFIEPDLADIPGGSFLMGSTTPEAGGDEKPVHTVSISPFKLSKTEVTFDEYDLFCKDAGRQNPGDESWGRGTRPVINVSWEDAKAYCIWLSEKTGKQYRLPTEAEWEYAAREGGKNVRFGNGKDIADPAEINFDGRADYKQPYSLVGEYRQKTVSVGSLRSNNSLGLHDMSGNVWEWCEDWYHDSYKGAPTDGSAWLSPAGSYRVIRGGSWNFYPQRVRVANRYSLGPALRYNLLGFRLARTK